MFSNLKVTSGENRLIRPINNLLQSYHVEVIKPYKHDEKFLQFPFKNLRNSITCSKSESTYYSSEVKTCTSQTMPICLRCSKINIWKAPIPTIVGAFLCQNGDIYFVFALCDDLIKKLFSCVFHCGE